MMMDHTAGRIVRPIMTLLLLPVTVADLMYAGLYLSDRLRNYSIEFSEGVNITTAEKKYDAAIGHKSKTKRAEAMNVWCERYLSTTEWTKLKSAIRKRRSRWERHGESTTITVSTKAHKYLVKISERDNVTYNDILEHVLAKTWSGSRTVPKRSAGKSKRRR